MDVIGCLIWEEFWEDTKRLSNPRGDDIHWYIDRWDRLCALESGSTSVEWDGLVREFRIWFGS